MSFSLFRLCRSRSKNSKKKTRPSFTSHRAFKALPFHSNIYKMFEGALQSFAETKRSVERTRRAKTRRCQRHSRPLPSLSLSPLLPPPFVLPLPDLFFYLTSGPASSVGSLESIARQRKRKKSVYVRGFAMRKAHGKKADGGWQSKKGERRRF